MKMTSLMTTLISPLLQESLAIDAVLAHRGRLPGKVGATGVALENIFTIVSNQFVTMSHKVPGIRAACQAHPIHRSGERLQRASPKEER